MNEEQYVSFEVAKLLKEKGFTEFCLYYYQGDNPIRTCSQDRSCYEWNNNHIGEEWYSAPTQQMACDWVEEAYGFFIEISRSRDRKGNYHYFYMILDKTCKYASSATKDNDYSSKFDAVESALEYVLTKLI